MVGAAHDVLLILFGQRAAVLKQDAERAQLPTVNGVSHSVEFVQDFVGGARMARQHLARPFLVAAGHVATQMRIGPMVDQVLNQFVAALPRRSVQCCDANGIRPIDIGPALDQQLHRCQAVVVGGVEQCGLPLAGENIDDSSMLQQKVDCLPVATKHGGVKRRKTRFAQLVDRFRVLSNRLLHGLHVVRDHKLVHAPCLLRK